MTPDVVVGVAVRMFVWRSLVILKFLFCFVLSRSRDSDFVFWFTLIGLLVIFFLTCSVAVPTSNIVLCFIPIHVLFGI